MYPVAGCFSPSPHPLSTYFCDRTTASGSTSGGDGTFHSTLKPSATSSILLPELFCKLENGEEFNIARVGILPMGSDAAIRFAPESESSLDPDCFGLTPVAIPHRDLTASRKSTEANPEPLSVPKTVRLSNVHSLSISSSSC